MLLVLVLSSPDTSTSLASFSLDPYKGHCWKQDHWTDQWGCHGWLTPLLELCWSFPEAHTRLASIPGPRKTAPSRSTSLESSLRVLTDSAVLWFILCSLSKGTHWNDLPTCLIWYATGVRLLLLLTSFKCSTRWKDEFLCSSEMEFLSFPAQGCSPHFQYREQMM